MIEIRHLVPESLSPYREAIGEAFAYFQKRTAASARGVDAPRAANDPAFGRLIRLALESPTLHKLAQVLARHRSLPLDLRLELQTLESFVPRRPMDETLAIVREELGDGLNELELETAALAEASVAVVVPFLWRSHGGDPSRGVLKVLKPGASEQLERELAVWPDVGEVFGDRCRRDGLPDVDYREPFDTVASLLRHEIDFAAEQRHLALAGATLTGVHGVRVPRLLPFCTPRVTAMERLDGVKVTNTDTFTASARRCLARRVVEALLAQPMFSAQPEAMFHADPHAGNLVATDSGELAILDWALVGFLTAADREQLAQMVLSAQLLDVNGVCLAVERLSKMARPDAVSLRAVVERSLAQSRNALGPSFSWLTGLLDAAAMKCGLRFSENLLLFRKTLLILRGVIEDIIGDGALDGLLMSSAMNQLSEEWPARLFSPPGSRRFGSRLSTLDLLRMGSSLPFAAASRWWQNVP